MTGAAPTSGGRQTDVNGEPSVSGPVAEHPSGSLPRVEVQPRGEGQARVEAKPRVEGQKASAAPRVTVPPTRQTRQTGVVSGHRRLHEPVVGMPAQVEVPARGGIPVPVHSEVPVQGDAPARSEVPVQGDAPVRSEVPVQREVAPQPGAPAQGKVPPRALPVQPGMPLQGRMPVQAKAAPSTAVPVEDQQAVSTGRNVASDPVAREERHLETPTLTRMNLAEALNATGRGQAGGGTATAEKTAAGVKDASAPEAVQAEPQAKPKSSPKSTGAGLYLLVKEVLVVVTLALVLALVAKTWVMQTFEIPSDSMLNTLQKKDRVTVSKVMVGPLDVGRGDVVVFEDPAQWLRGVDKTEKKNGPLGEFFGSIMTWIGLMPNDAGNHVIKRIIGMPGDKVECCDDRGRLLVNGTPIDEPYVFPGKKPSEERFSIVVPAGKIWVMGDNRNNSLDSRYNDLRFQFEGVTHSNGQRLSGNQKPEGYQSDPQDSTGYFGSVPLKNVVGKAVVMVWPLNRLGILGGSPDTFAHVPAPDPTAVPGPIPGVSKASQEPPKPSPSASASSAEPTEDEPAEAP